MNDEVYRIRIEVYEPIDTEGNYDLIDSLDMRCEAYNMPTEVTEDDKRVYEINVNLTASNVTVYNRKYKEIGKRKKIKED